MVDSHDGEPRQRWLLMIYRVAQNPPGRRTYVWRQLRQLGAVYLQQAAAIHPDRSELRPTLDALADRIRLQEGDVALLEAISPSAEREKEIVARFNRARDDEYAEVVENALRLEDEIWRETCNLKFTFAELEDVESEWEKLQRWQERVITRDFFGAPGRARADAALESCAALLATFSSAVYQHEGVHSVEEHADDTAN